MKQITLLTIVVALAAGIISAQSKVTVLEGARVIVGDGKTIDNATIVVQGDRFTQVGPAASVKVSVGATRVSVTEPACAAASAICS